MTQRLIPIFDLTPFASLFDWTIAIERFLQTGNAEMMRKLGIEELKPLLAETKGEIGGGLRELITSLDNFSQNVLTCRSPESKSNIERILNAIPKAKKELGKLRPFKPLFVNNPLLHSPINKLSRTYPHAFSQLYEVES